MKAKQKINYNDIAENQHLGIYEDVVSMLWTYTDENLESIAVDANICPKTLTNWMSGKVKCPHLRTLYNVIWVMGYELTIVSRGAKLRLVK